ncbi:RNA polymerase sigma factor [Chitinophaga nivalis]|uniref:RNA polymerase sigma-70 factor n=1 Tax=Chitinophaga nivalis TaxID=2991709 RepID=A0ABT3IN57_9BACT|nr:RNA polymerase sigma-70 factor [Chitinophaga nivalis]MCW3464890.1 RNA polymerase sigma-70 factor [Chitinophaga nivalis]MCW3485419.1 RNA polymerase sigma-70 factor [Chitinophaga nivalis]
MTDYTVLSDPELATLLAADSELAFAEIYRRYSRLLFGYACKKLQDPEEAKDIVQEIFVQLWNKRNTYSMQTSLAGYLYRSVRNRALDLFAHKKVADQYLTSLQHFLDQDNILTDHLVREKEITLLIEKEIAALPPKMREVFELSRKAHLSHREIADRLHISEQTVTKQVKKALKLLKVRLGVLLYLIWQLHS